MRLPPQVIYTKLKLIFEYMSYQKIILLQLLYQTQTQTQTQTQKNINIHLL